MTDRSKLTGIGAVHGRPARWRSGPNRRQTLAGLSGLLLAAGTGQALGQAVGQGGGKGGGKGSGKGDGKGKAAAGVDLLLVLAVDASGSVSEDRFTLQRQGYARAFRNPRILRSIRSGMLGAIGVTMVQWTGPDLHVVVVPWTRVNSKATLEALAHRIDKSPRELFGGGTSISGAIDYSRTLLDAAPWNARRRVIDISGDGYNSSGRFVQTARDEAVKAGVIINGLPILALAPGLDDHYARDVIGGPGSFSVPSPSYEKFAEAIQRKLILEIAYKENEKIII